MAAPSLSALRDALTRLLKSTPDPLIEFDADIARLPARAVGQVVQARVAAQLPNGRSVVDIQGAPFDVKLPVPVRVGDTLELEVLALEPRPTFALRSAPPPIVELEVPPAQTPARAVGQVLQAQVVATLPDGRSSIEMQGARFDVKLPGPARVGEPLQLEVRTIEPRVTLAVMGSPARSAREPVAVSDTVRRLAAILDRLAAAPAARAGIAAPPAGPASPTPMPIATSAIPAAAPGPATPLAPSNAVTAAPTVKDTTPVAGATTMTPVIESPPRETPVLAENLRQALTRSGLFYESHQAQWVAGERPLEELMREPQAGLKPTGEPVHPQAIGLVRQQLEVLDTRQLVWQGQVWPEQSMEWRIEEDRSGATSSEALPLWKTSLRLTLPRLGEVTALLSIQGDEVRLAFADLADDTRYTVRDGQGTLRDALAKAGLALVEVKVGRDEA